MRRLRPGLRRGLADTAQEERHRDEARRIVEIHLNACTRCADMSFEVARGTLDIVGESAMARAMLL